tara:strand:- start:78 stop:260 length:183 start_codon:yes stop_codon:yes gene_type:complete
MAIKKLIRRVFGSNIGKAIYWQEDGKEFIAFKRKSGEILNVSEVTNTSELLKDLKIKLTE